MARRSTRASSEKREGRGEERQVRRQFHPSSRGPFLVGRLRLVLRLRDRFRLPVRLVGWFGRCLRLRTWSDLTAQILRFFHHPLRVLLQFSGVDVDRGMARRLPVGDDTCHRENQHTDRREQNQKNQAHVISSFGPGNVLKRELPARGMCKWRAGFRPQEGTHSAAFCVPISALSRQGAGIRGGMGRGDPAAATVPVPDPRNARRPTPRGPRSP